MNIPVDKLKAIILYFCTNTDPKFLGKVKLMKLFYFLDFLHVKNYGAPVTYDTYINLEHGPIPSFIKNIVDGVADDPENSVLSDTMIVERQEDRNIQRIVCLRKFTQSDERHFSQSELEILKKVCLRFGNFSTKYIEEASHQEAPWKKTNLLDEIPYTLAAQDEDAKVSEEEIKLLLELHGI